MKKAAVLFIILISLFLFGCGNSDEQLDALGRDYSDEQLDALERLDPLHLLTDNKAIFTLDQSAVLNNLEEKIDLPDWAEQMPNGNIRLEQYPGCTEPIFLTYTFKSGGREAVGIIYGIIYAHNTPAVIQDYPAFITQLREDLITLYGDKYTESFPHTECESFEEMIQLIKDNKAVDYTLSLGSFKKLYVMLGEGCMDGSMEFFSISICLEP